MDARMAVEREAILEAARQCFDALGYEATSMGAIAAKCGLSQRVLERHFATKADVRNALFNLWSEQMSAWIGNA